MKKILSISTILAMSTIAGAETLYYNGVNDDSLWGLATTWIDSDGNPASAAPSDSSDLIVDFDRVNADMRTVYGAIRTTAINNLTVNSLTWQNIKTLTLHDKSSGAETKSSQFRLAMGTWQSTDRPVNFTILNDFKASAAAGSNVSNIFGACELNTPSTMPKIVIGGNFQLGDVATKDVAGTYYKLDIGNNGCQTVGGYTGPQYFEVGKNVNLIGATSLTFNVGNDSVAPTLETPSVMIKGVVNFEGGTSGNPIFVLNSRNIGSGTGNPSGVKNNPVFFVGGFNGNVGQISNFTRSSAIGYLGGLSTVVLKTADNADYTYWGSIYDDDTTDAQGQRAQIKFISDGNGIQRLSGKNAFSGGITMLSGTLLVGSNYASEQNHGDLTIRGGKFGNSRTTARTWSATNLVIGSNNGINGTIDIYVNSSSDFDKIAFSGAAIKDESFVDGMSKLIIDFSGNASTLIGGGEFKIFSFESTSDSAGFQSSDFISSTIIEKDGLNYTAQFRFDDGKTLVSDAGLYATFVQVVPEPATISAILGAFAFAIAVYRKLK